MMKLKDFYEVWNDLHCKAVKVDSNTRNIVMIKWCENILLEAKETYYTGNPIMEDIVYDKIESYLEALDKDNSVLQKVGHGI